MAITPYRSKWKSTMTDRERFNNQMHHKPVDRCFNMEFGYWYENFTAWPIFVDNGVKNNGDAETFFSFDLFHGYKGNIWMSPSFTEEVIEESATKKIIRNRDGLLAEVPKDDHETIPHFLESSIVTPDDWKRLKKERFHLDDPARKIDIEALKNEHPPSRTYPLGVHCGSMIGKIRDMLTFEGLAYAVYDYPDMVEDMVETACVLVENMLDQVLPYVDFDLALGWEDICFKNGPIVSVDFFRDVLTPRYKRISKKLTAHGIDIWLTDCDGDIRPILPYFLEGGVNTMFPFEINSSGHPAPLLDEFGPELRIMGGVDKIVLASGKQAIKDYLKTLTPLVERGGYIPFCDHRCPPNVNPNDYLYYLNLKEELFGMK